MRWKNDQKEETRGRIVAAAGRLFRARGFAGTSVAEVMEGADRTVGGFYAHFDSKEELLASVLAEASTRAEATLFAGLDDVRGVAFVREALRRYLSPFHRDAVAEGCPLPSLAAEVGRDGSAPRDALETYLRSMIATLVERGPAPDDAASRELAIALVAMSVGGLLLARSVADPALSNEILAACRRVASRALAA